MNAPRRASHRVHLLALGLFVLLGLVYAWSSADEGVGIDFYQFWSVGQAVREGLVETVYGPEAWPRLARIFLERAEEDGARRHRVAAAFRREEIQTSNTPFLYTVFWAFESGTYETDIKRFRAMGLAAATASILALCWGAGYGAAGALTSLAFVLWAFPPLHYDLREGNVNAFQMGCIALFLLLARGGRRTWCHLAAGAALGAGVAFKPNLLFVPLALLIAWVVRRRWRALVLRSSGMAAGGLVAVALGGAFFGGLSAWAEWVRTLSRIRETFGSEVRWGSFGGGRLLLDLTGRDLSPLLYLLCLAGLAWALRRGGWGQGAAEGGSDAATFEEDFLVAGVGPLIPLVAADLAWPHYLVQALPAALWLLRPDGPTGRSPAGTVLVAAGLVGACSSPFVDLLAPGSDYAYAVPLAAGSLLLLLSGLLEAAGAWGRGRVPE